MAIQRRASWLELFYDLVFVIVIANISDFLFQHPTWYGLGVTLALFMLGWWIWIGFAYFLDMFENTYHWFQVVIYLAMLGCMVLAVQIKHLHMGDFSAVILAYFALRALLVVTYGIARCLKKADRAFLDLYLIGFTVGATCWLIAYLTSNLWWCLIGFSVEFFTPLSVYLFSTARPNQVSHMDERFGLFLLIVLGETIASVAYSINQSHWDVTKTLLCIFSFMSAIAIWRLYFARIQSDVVNRSLRAGKLTILRFYTFVQSHVLIALAIVLYGVSLQWLILHTATVHFHQLYVLSLAVYVACLSINQLAAKSLHSRREITLRVLVIASLAGLAQSGLPVDVLSALAMMATCLLVVVEYRSQCHAP